MTDSRLMPNQTAASAGRQRGHAALFGLMGGCALIALLLQAVYVHVLYGRPTVEGEDPVRTLARVVFVGVVLLACYPICSRMADGRSRLASIVDTTARLLDRQRNLQWLLPVCFALTLAALLALRAFPNSGDEYNYIYQAETFLAGRLWNPLPEAFDLFRFSHIFMQDGKWVSQYPPGWAALLGAGHSLGLPYWLMNPLLGVVLLALTYRVAAARGGVVAASLAALLVGLSIYFLFNAASYFPHISVAIFGVAFCAAAENFRQAPRVIAALSMGVFIGLIGLSRPFDAVLFALPYAATILVRLRLVHLKYGLFAALGVLPFLAAILVYNGAVTGSALLPVTSWGYPELKLGILEAVYPNGEVVTLADRARHTLSRLYLMAEWTSPVFLILFGSSFAHLWRQRALVPADWMIFVFLLGYLMFPGHGGLQYGPRYYFEAYPLMAITVGTAVADWLRRDATERTARFATALVAAHIVLAIAAMPPFMRAMHAIVTERMDLYNLVAREKLRKAVVVVEAATGRLDPMGPFDLTRNGIELNGEVIYALAGRDWETRLKALYPSRQIYVYRREADAVSGRLDPVK